MSGYRKIWEEANGPIPYDSDNRRMEIHHIDGDRTNNSLSNLTLLTITDHYAIHYAQGNWGACQSIINRMQVTPAQKSKICSELANQRIADRTHHFLDPEFIKKDSERKSRTLRGENNPMYGKKMSKESTDKQSVAHKKLVALGTHHLLSQEHKDRMRTKALQALDEGTHIFQQQKTREKISATHTKLLKENTHPFNSINRIDPNKIKAKCEICGKETTLPALKRFHKH